MRRRADNHVWFLKIDFFGGFFDTVTICEHIDESSPIVFFVWRRFYPYKIYSVNLFGFVVGIFIDLRFFAHTVVKTRGKYTYRMAAFDQFFRKVEVARPSREARRNRVMIENPDSHYVDMFVGR